VIAEAQLREHFESVRRLRDGDWLVTCPAHDDRQPSLHVTRGRNRWLLKCHAGCDLGDVLEQAGLTRADLFEDSNGHREIEAIYRYEDEQGRPLFEVVRFEGKQFRQRRPDGSWGLGDTRRVLYRLPRVLAAIEKGEVVWIVEGEKDVHALEELELVATCNPMGAGKWRDDYSQALRGAKVAIVADADDKGREHAGKVTESLEGVAAEIEVSEPTKGKDISEHLAMGGRLEELAEICCSSCSTPRDEQHEQNPEEPFAAPMSQKLAGIPPEPEWVWQGYLAPGALTLLAGRPKVGKTTLLFPLIAALEQGRPFLDRPTRRSRVLVLSEEREQTLAEKRQLYLDGADPLLLMRHERGQRHWAQLIEQARRYCAEHHVGLLVVDTWDKWTGLRGDDESKAGAVIEALEPLMLAASDGLAVLIVAHQRKAAGKHGEAVRGSNAITGGVDVIVELERASEDLGRRLRVLRAESRFTATPEELVGELTQEGYVARGELEEVTRKAERESTVRLAEASPGATADELAEAAETSRPTMSRRLNDAWEHGLIERSGDGRKGAPYRWSACFCSSGSTPRDEQNEQHSGGLCDTGTSDPDRGCDTEPEPSPNGQPDGEPSPNGEIDRDADRELAARADEVQERFSFGADEEAPF
jgi:5S rRNA maturation endonuclease (ribonuclease M5)/DNA-binding transcriptional ArsR family regulator